MVFMRAKTEMTFVIQQIIGLQSIDWRADILQSSERRLCIQFRRSDEDVEIPSGAHLSMHIDSDSAHYGELNVFGEKRGE